MLDQMSGHLIVEYICKELLRHNNRGVISQQCRISFHFIFLRFTIDIFSPRPFQTVFVEVLVLETGAELIVLPNELSAFSSLMIDHIHLFRSPVFVEVLLIPFDDEGF